VTVDHRELASLFDASGPFASIYLDTSGDVEQAAARVALRWKNLRGELLEAGVPEATLAGIDPLVEGSHTAGATLAVIAAVDGVVYQGSFPEPPARDTLVRLGPLPYMLPLLAWSQRLVPHVAVLTDRTGADLAARTADGSDHSQRVEGRTPPHIHKPAAGGWSQPRYQHRSEVLWESNAGEVAEALTRLVDRVRPRFVAAAGDVRALQLLREQLPKRVRERLEVVGGEYRSLEAVFAHADQLAADAAEADTAAVLGRFAEERGQGDLAAEGAAATLAALARGQVDTLLVTDDPDDQRTAWFGEAAVQVGPDAATVTAMGSATAVQARLADVAVRAALGTGAAVHVLAPGQPGAPRDGLGTLLRFAG
jgi:Bacterial archaeo-eukaryotic release factor family 2